MSYPQVKRDLAEAQRNIISGRLVRTPFFYVNITTRGTILKPVSQPQDTKTTNNSNAVARWA